DVVMGRPAARFYLMAAATIIVTLATLPFLWGRALLMVVLPLGDHLQPAVREIRFAASIPVAIAACMVLSWLMARWSPSKITLAWVCASMVFVWFSALTILIAIVAQGDTPVMAFIPIFTFASLWLLWLSWLPAWPVSWLARAAVLLVLLAGPVAFVALF